MSVGFGLLRHQEVFRSVGWKWVCLWSGGWLLLFVDGIEMLTK